MAVALAEGSGLVGSVLEAVLDATALLAIELAPRTCT